ncbi:DEAD/DEAH box helicase [Nocardia sp. GCM10030253]|uniref:DEAD/DEAH box helicase n=1 Tax=Nocardia sp. GCM10030253 TaxID=3273404 RepID=UPI0036260A2B
MTTRSSSPAPVTSFAALGVRKKLVDALASNGITAPFPIQAATLPDSLAGRDVLGRGKTGSGKTLAFSIPMVDRLAGGVRKPGRPSGLILAPTRELATQITATLEPMAVACGLTVTTIIGGVSQVRQSRALAAGVDIVVACPGRLEDLMRQRVVHLNEVQVTVLDEADHMADLGFLPAVTRILAATQSTGQRLLFSATLDNGVDKLVKRFMRNPASHSVDEANSPVAAMTHHVFEVGGVDAKNALVRTLASGGGRRILFMRTKHQARKLAKQLTTAGIPATDLHGNLSQVARDRNLAAFTEGTARVLVATDIAARGVHVDDVELVVHVDPPAEHKAYLHRSGRTARAGSAGDVVTVVLPEQRRDVAGLLRKAGIQVSPQRVTADSTPVTDLVGEIAPLVAPTYNPTASTHTGGQARNRNSRPSGDAGRGGPSRARGAATGGSRTRAGQGAGGGQPRRRDNDTVAGGRGTGFDGRSSGRSERAAGPSRSSDGRGTGFDGRPSGRTERGAGFDGRSRGSAERAAGPSRNGDGRGAGFDGQSRGRADHGAAAGGQRSRNGRGAGVAVARGTDSAAARSQGRPARTGASHTRTASRDQAAPPRAGRR